MNEIEELKRRVEVLEGRDKPPEVQPRRVWTGRGWVSTGDISFQTPILP